MSKRPKIIILSAGFNQQPMEDHLHELHSLWHCSTIKGQLVITVKGFQLTKISHGINHTQKEGNLRERIKWGITLGSATQAHMTYLILSRTVQHSEYQVQETPLLCLLLRLF